MSDWWSNPNQVLNSAKKVISKSPSSDSLSSPSSSSSSSTSSSSSSSSNSASNFQERQEKNISALTIVEDLKKENKDCTQRRFTQQSPSKTAKSTTANATSSSTSTKSIPASWWSTGINVLSPAATKDTVQKGGSSVTPLHKSSNHVNHTKPTSAKNVAVNPSESSLFPQKIQPEISIQNPNNSNNKTSTSWWNNPAAADGANVVLSTHSRTAPAHDHICKAKSMYVSDFREPADSFETVGNGDGTDGDADDNVDGGESGVRRRYYIKEPSSSPTTTREKEDARVRKWSLSQKTCLEYVDNFNERNAIKNVIREAMILDESSTSSQYWELLSKLADNSFISSTPNFCYKVYKELMYQLNQVNWKISGGGLSALKMLSILHRFTLEGGAYTIDLSCSEIKSHIRFVPENLLQVWARDSNEPRIKKHPLRAIITGISRFLLMKFDLLETYPELEPNYSTDRHDFQVGQGKPNNAYRVEDMCENLFRILEYLMPVLKNMLQEACSDENYRYLQDILDFTSRHLLVDGIYLVLACNAKYDENEPSDSMIALFRDNKNLVAEFAEAVSNYRSCSRHFHTLQESVESAKRSMSNWIFGKEQIRKHLIQGRVLELRKVPGLSPRTLDPRNVPCSFSSFKEMQRALNPLRN